MKITFSRLDENRSVSCGCVGRSRSQRRYTFVRFTLLFLFVRLALVEDIVISFVASDFYGKRCVDGQLRNTFLIKSEEIYEINYVYGVVIMKNTMNLMRS